jgi:hypothetical protein
VNFAFAVALNEPEIAPVEPVVDLLHGMADLIRRLAPSFFAFV